MSITVSDLDGIVQKANALAEELRMKLRHSNCQNSDCPICLEDHRNLARILQEKTGSDKHDLLYEYRIWLIEQKIPDVSESWASPQAFEDANIERFCEWFKKRL